MKEYLWIGSFSTDEVNKTLQGWGYNNAAQHIAQKNLLEGLEYELKCSFTCIGSIMLPDTVSIKKVDTIRFGHNESENDVLVGYRNIRYLNRLSASRNVGDEIRKYLKKIESNTEMIVFMYEMRGMCFNVAQLIREYHPNSKIYMFVPDLPMFMSGSYTLIKHLLKHIDYKIMQRKTKYIDKYILFTEPMAEYLKINKSQYIVMEGSININEINNSTPNIAEYTTGTDVVFMYSGIIDESYGLIELIEAFKKLPSHYKLWITGDGVSAEKVRLLSDGEKIIYYGFLDSRKKVLEKQKKATALINLRNPNEDSSKYCFPSKLFEYMRSGRVVLSTRIQGIPSEYYHYLIEIKDVTVNEITKAVLKVAEMTEKDRDELAYSAKRYIEEKKNNIVQTRRIIEELL